MPATIATLRASVVAHLQAIPQLAGVAVLAEDRDDVVTAISTALAQGRGLVLVVSTGAERFTQGGNPVPVSDVDVYVEVGEIPAINRGPKGARIPASDVSCLVVRALHHFVWTPGKVLVADAKAYDRNDKSKVVTYTPIFKTKVEYPGGSPVPQPLKTSTPQ